MVETSNQITLPPKKLPFVRVGGILSQSELVPDEVCARDSRCCLAFQGDELPLLSGDGEKNV